VVTAPHAKFLCPCVNNTAVTRRAMKEKERATSQIEACVSLTNRLSTPSYVLEGFARVFAKVLVSHPHSISLGLVVCDWVGLLHSSVAVVAASANPEARNLTLPGTCGVTWRQRGDKDVSTLTQQIYEKALAAGPVVAHTWADRVNDSSSPEAEAKLSAFLHAQCVRGGACLTSFGVRFPRCCVQPSGRAATGLRGSTRAR
jgi:hypothetical protein